MLHEYMDSYEHFHNLGQVWAKLPVFQVVLDLGYKGYGAE